MAWKRFFLKKDPKGESQNKPVRKSSWTDLTCELIFKRKMLKTKRQKVNWMVYSQKGSGHFISSLGTSTLNYFGVRSSFVCAIHTPEKEDRISRIKLTNLIHYYYSYFHFNLPSLTLYKDHFEGETFLRFCQCPHREVKKYCPCLVILVYWKKKKE